MGTWTVINPNGKEYTGEKLVRLCLNAQREYIGEEEWLQRLKKGLEPDPDFPVVVCLCGSTKFKDEFVRQGFNETLAGKIVLSIGCDMKSDDELFGHMTPEQFSEVKARLDELHKRKIDMADEVLILNVGGYIGSSTRSELEYAQASGKKIRFLETSGS